MSKIAYVAKRFRSESLSLIERVNGVITDYREQGYNLNEDHFVLGTKKGEAYAFYKVTEDGMVLEEQAIESCMYHKKTYLKKTDEVKPHVERKKVGEKNRWDIPASYKALVLPQFANAVWKNNEMDWTIITIYVPTDTVIQEYEK